MADPIAEARADWSKQMNKGFLSQYESVIKETDILDKEIPQLLSDLSTTDSRNLDRKIPVLTDNDSSVKDRNSKMFMVSLILGLSIWGVRKWLR